MPLDLFSVQEGVLHTTYIHTSHYLTINLHFMDSLEACLEFRSLEIWDSGLES